MLVTSGKIQRNKNWKKTNENDSAEMPEKCLTENSLNSSGAITHPVTAGFSRWRLQFAEQTVVIEISLETPAQKI